MKERKKIQKKHLNLFDILAKRENVSEKKSILRGQAGNDILDGCYGCELILWKEMDNDICDSNDLARVCYLLK